MKRKLIHFFAIFSVVLYFCIDGMTYVITSKPAPQLYAFFAALASLIAVLTDSDNQ